MDKRSKQEDQYSQQETEQRVQRALAGAFNGSPTSFKAAPPKARASRSKPATAKRRKSA